MIAALPKGRAGPPLALMILLLLGFSLWQVVAAPLIDTYRDRAETLVQRQRLLRRMTDIAAQGPALERQRVQQTASPAIASVLVGGSDAVAGAELLQITQDLAARTGAVLSSTETLPGEAAGPYRKIAVRVAMVAPWPVLIRMLQAIEDGPPAMLTDDVRLRRTPAIGATDPPLDASFTLFSFRAAGSEP